MDSADRAFEYPVVMADLPCNKYTQAASTHASTREYMQSDQLGAAKRHMYIHAHMHTNVRICIHARTHARTQRVVLLNCCLSLRLSCSHRTYTCKHARRHHTHMPPHTEHSQRENPRLTMDVTVLTAPLLTTEVVVFFAIFEAETAIEPPVCMT